MSSVAIRFACPVCGGNVRAPSGQLGHDVLCPHCGNTVVVPDPNAAAAPVAEQNDAKSTTPASSPPSSKPRAKKAAVNPDAPLRIDDDTTQPGEFAVTCPTCGTRVAAMPEQIGKAVRCPDCYSAVPVLPSEARPAPRPEPNRFEDDVSFSPDVPTPRYIPASTSGINAAELYGQDAAPQSSADPASAQEQEITVSCPICHTRVAAWPSQIGSNIRCPDCETPFEVHAPRPKAPNQRVTLDEGEEFRLSELFERPKYQSSTRGTVSRDELDMMQLNEAERLPPEPRPPQPAPTSAAGRIDFFVTCPTCASRVGARYDQVGQTIRCSDCDSDLVATAPRVKKSAPISEQPAAHQIDIPQYDEPVAPPVADRDVIVTRAAPPLQSSPPAPAEPNPIQDIYAQQSRKAMDKAEKEAEEHESNIKLEDLPPFQQLFTVLFELAIVTRIAYIGSAVGCVLLLFALGQYLIKSGQGALSGPLGLIIFVILVPLVGYVFKSMISIVQGTAVGQVKIQEWYTDDFYSALAAVFQAFFAFGISSMPGGILASILYSSGVPAVFFAFLFPLSIFLLFPFVLLSQLEGEHPFYVISLPVARSMRLAPAAWIRCYGESFVLFLATTALLYLPMLDYLLCGIMGAYGLVTIAVLFARSIGILGYACNRALLRESIRQEQLAAAQLER